MTLWLLRAAWFSLPVTAGPAAAAALRGTSTPVAVVAGVLLWAPWSILALGLLVLRPLTLTMLRIATPIAVAIAVLAAARPAVSTLGASVAITVTAAAAAISALPAIGAMFVNGAAYGDERRFPLRIPPVLWVGPVPVAVLLAGAGIAAGPLLLAARNFVLGAVALVGGAVLAAALARSLHSLSRRWAVVVPAGLVLHDPLTLADPVLFPRERIAALAVVDPLAPPDAITLDIRLAALGGSVRLELTDPAQIVKARPGKRGGEVVIAQRVLFTPTRPGDLLALARTRRIAAANRFVPEKGTP